MVNIKKIKIKKDYKNPLLLIVYKNEVNKDGKYEPIGVASISPKKWKKEYEKFYNALLKDNKDYIIQVVTTEDNNPKIGKELLFEDRIIITK